jgi:hypothetical protein
MKKSSVLMLVALFLVVGFAAASWAENPPPNLKVANTSQNGSLLIFPKIDTKANFNSLLVPSFDRDTIVTIGNSGPREVTIQCFWTFPTVNADLKNTPAAEEPLKTAAGQTKYLEFSRKGTGVQGWTKTIKPQAVIYFSAATGINDAFGLNLTTGGNAFPTGQGSLGSGALTCFAIRSTSNKKPISITIYECRVTISQCINETIIHHYLIMAQTWKYRHGFRAHVKTNQSW